MMLVPSGWQRQQDELVGLLLDSRLIRLGYESETSEQNEQCERA